MIKLQPRLNYKYTIFDAIQSLTALFKKEFNDNVLKQLFDNENVFYVNHSRTGIWVALKALDLQPGSRIGVQAYNCHTVFNAISQAGHKPVFLDVTDAFQIDLEDLKRKVNQLDALIVTHLFGIPAPMTAVKKITEGIVIIEDCVHSFLSRYNGALTGTLGDFGVFSIGKGKFPSIGGGGYILVNEKKYNAVVRDYIDRMPKNSILTEIKAILGSLILNFLHQSFIYKLLTSTVLKKVDKHKDLGGKFKFEIKRILNVNRRLFLKKMNTCAVQKEIQKKNAQEICKVHAAETKFFGHLPSSEYDLNYFMVPILTDGDQEKLIHDYFKRGIELGAHFSQSINWAQELDYEIGSCPNAEKIASQIITFPTYYKIPKFC